MRRCLILKSRIRGILGLSRYKFLLQTPSSVLDKVIAGLGEKYKNCSSLETFLTKANRKSPTLWQISPENAVSLKHTKVVNPQTSQKLPFYFQKSGRLSQHSMLKSFLTFSQMPSSYHRISTHKFRFPPAKLSSTQARKTKGTQNVCSWSLTFSYLAESFAQTQVSWRVLRGNEQCSNNFRRRKFRLQRAKCLSGNPV